VTGTGWPYPGSTPPIRVPRGPHLHLLPPVSPPDPSGGGREGPLPRPRGCPRPFRAREVPGPGKDQGRTKSRARRNPRNPDGSPRTHLAQRPCATLIVCPGACSMNKCFPALAACCGRPLRPSAPFAPPRAGGSHSGLGEDHPWPISGVPIAEPRRSGSPRAAPHAARPSPFMTRGASGSVSVAVGDATSTFPDRKTGASGAAPRFGTSPGGLQQRRRPWFFSWAEEGCSWPGLQGPSPPPTPPSKWPRPPGERLRTSPRSVPPRQARASRWIPWRPLWMAQDRRWMAQDRLSPSRTPMSRLRIPHRAA